MNETANEEILTLTEIEQKFDSEWILLGDPELDQNNEIVRGKALCHSKNRDDVYAKAMELRPNHSASLYTGPMPEDIWINLNL